MGVSDLWNGMNKPSPVYITLEEAPTSSSSKSGLVKNLAKKYSSLAVSDSGSLLRLRLKLDALLPSDERLVPNIARSFVVASRMTGRTLLTASLNSVKVEGDEANKGGFEKGSWRDQKVL